MHTVKQGLLVLGQAPSLFLLFAFLGFSPFVDLVSQGPLGLHDRQRLFALGLLSFVALLALWNGKIQAVSFRRPASIQVALGAFFFLGLLSSLSAFSPKLALHEWATFLLIVLLSAWIAEEVARSLRNGVDGVLLAVGLVCVIYVFKSAVNYLVGMVFGFPPLISDIVFGFDNYRFFNHIQTVSLPLVVLLAVRNYSNGRAWLWVASAWWALLFFAGGRGTMVALVVSTAVSALIFGESGRRWAVVMGKAAFIGFALNLVLFVLLPMMRFDSPLGLLGDMVSRSVENPLSSREILWAAAIKMALDNPLLGVGPVHFAHHGTYLGINAHPHNSVLQIAAEWGLPALMCIVFAIAACLRNLFRKIKSLPEADRKETLTGVALFATAIAILVDGLVSGLMVMPTSQLWIALFLGLTWGWSRSIRETSGAIDAGRLVRRSYVRAGALVVVLALWVGVLPDALNLSERETQALKSNVYVDAVLYPRIWRAGYF